MPAGREICKPPASPLCALCTALDWFLCQLILLMGKTDSARAFSGPRSRLVMEKGSAAETFPKLPWETTMSHPGPLFKTADCWGLQGSPWRELGLDVCSISSKTSEPAPHRAMAPREQQGALLQAARWTGLGPEPAAAGTREQVAGDLDARARRAAQRRVQASQDTGPGGAAPGRLLGVVHPAVLGGSLLPAGRQLILAVRVVQARVAESCHGGDRSNRRVSPQQLTLPSTAPPRFTERPAPRPRAARACALQAQPIRSCNPVSCFRGDWRERGRNLKREAMEAQERPNGLAAGRKNRNGSETGISVFTRWKGRVHSVTVQDSARCWATRNHFLIVLPNPE